MELKYGEFFIQPDYLAASFLCAGTVREGNSNLVMILSVM